jgi:hypothetical protein
MKFARSKLNLIESPFERSLLLLIEQPDQRLDQRLDQQSGSDRPNQQDVTSPPDNQSSASNSSPVEVKEVSKVSPEFSQQIQIAIASIPDSLWKMLSDEGYSVVTTATMAEVLQPSQSGVDWNQVSSVVDSGNKHIVIAEITLDRAGNQAPNLNPEGLLRHSTGHVVDTLAPKFVTKHYHDKFSDLENFKYAHTSDMTRLSQNKQAKLAYYTADGDISRAECFAECFAALHGGGAVYTIDVMSKYFPAVMKQVKELVTYAEKDKSITSPDQGDDQDIEDQEPEGQNKESEPEPA